MAGALFLDRDGIVNEERDYVGRREDFVFIPAVFDLVAAGIRLGLLPVIVTNQSGIGRGYYSEADYISLTDWMKAEFDARGAPLAAVYHCPWHPEAKVAAYRREHPWRKPQPGMFFAAAEDLSLDLAKSIMVGDRWRDIEAAQRAGVPERVLVGEGALDPQPDGVTATLTVADVAAAAAWLAGKAP
jgi:D-glycero-D-manno-heptose 1,7-bisphosphate phosphatase